MDFSKYIHAVGTGPKGNRDLTFAEAQDMMQQILNQSIPSEQIAAFLLGWRLKPETIEEFRGAIEASQPYITHHHVKNSLELGYPFDGKAKNPYLFPLIAQELQKTDLQLIIIGDEKQPAKNGITTKEIATHLEFAKNIHFFDRAEFFHKMHQLTEIRTKLSLRTGFNTIEKLPNVAQSDFAITGVFHKPYVQKYVEIFSDKYKRFALIQGNEGTPELFSKGRLWITENGQTQEYIIDPQHYGIEYKKSLEKITLEESLALVKNPTQEFQKLAKLNAAVYLFVADKAQNIDQAYDMLQNA
jgi:anthranilate phosphoribosyltransferase